MSLADFLAKYPRAYREDLPSGAVYVGCGSISVREYHAAMNDLCRLSDYFVSSGSCGGYYLVRK